MSPEIQRGPLGPEQMEALREEYIPEQVFEVFNQAIAQNLQRGYSRILQKDILAELEDRGMNRSEIFEKHWLDVEPSYREAGWDVYYERPIAWGGENFEAYFEFRTPRERRR